MKFEEALKEMKDGRVIENDGHRYRVASKSYWCGCEIQYCYLYNGSWSMWLNADDDESDCLPWGDILSDEWKIVIC